MDTERLFMMSFLMILILPIHLKLICLQLVTEMCDLTLIYTLVAKSVYLYLEPGEEVPMKIGTLNSLHSFRFWCLFRQSLCLIIFILMSLATNMSKVLFKEKKIMKDMLI